MKKDFVMPILVLSLICLLMSGALAVGNSITRPVIEEAAAGRAEAARMEIIPHTKGFVPLEAEGLPKTVTEVYGTPDDMGYIVMVTAAGGYGGTVELICGIGPDGKIIKTKVLAHNETQGLGTAVFDLKGPEYEGKDAAQIAGIDAIAGATITSSAYKRGVQDAFAAYEIVKGARP